MPAIVTFRDEEISGAERAQNLFFAGQDNYKVSQDMIESGDCIEDGNWISFTSLSPNSFEGELDGNHIAGSALELSITNGYIYQVAFRYTSTVSAPSIVFFTDGVDAKSDQLVVNTNFRYDENNRANVWLTANDTVVDGVGVGLLMVTGVQGTITVQDIVVRRYIP